MNKNIMFATMFGSRLYGTFNKNSDYDIKVVTLPTIEELILGNKTRTVHNINEETDSETITLHRFMNLAEQGQTMVFDMLWAPKDKWVDTNFNPANYELWENFIVPIRNQFITKNMNAFMGYAKSQAFKYSNKGKNINNIIKIKDAFSKYTEDNYKVQDIHIVDVNFDYKYSEGRDGSTLFSFNGYSYPVGMTVKNFIKEIDKILNKYGKRANEASETNNIDYKAMSHAFRVVSEVEELVTEGKITFPLKNVEFIKAIKYGNYTNVDYLTNKLNEEVDRVTNLINTSNLPLKPTVNTDEVIKNIYTYLYPELNKFF